MNIILWACIGALLGWLMSFRIGTLCHARLLIEIAIGLTGALLAGLLNTDSTRWFSTEFELLELATAGVGGALLLLITNLRAGRRLPSD